MPRSLRRGWRRLYVSAMHSVDPTTESMIRSVLAYAENRLRLDPVPLDRGSIDPAELDVALGGLPGSGPHTPDQVLGVYASVMAPAVISADSPRFLGFIPAAPTKASLLFDMLISCASIQGISWLEVAREVAKRKAGPAGSGRRWRVAVSEDAHSSITNTLRICEMDALVVRSDDHRLTGAGLRAALEADGDPGSG